MSGARTWIAQLTFAVAGQLMVGGVMSLTVMVWVQVSLLPHTSVALRSEERRVGMEQVWALITSPSKVTVTAPPQPSLAVTELMSGAGTWLAQLTVTAAGQL